MINSLVVEKEYLKNPASIPDWIKNELKINNTRKLS